MQYGYIYKITNPIGQIYIGQTINIKKRLDSYKYNRCKDQRKISLSIEMYKWEQHRVDIIYRFDLSKVDMDNAEIFFIHFFRSFYFSNRKIGLNLTKGGDSGGHIVSEETRKKMSLTRRGRKVVFSAEAIERIREGIKHRRKRTTIHKHTQETRDKMSQDRKGRIITKEWRENLSAASKERYKNFPAPWTGKQHTEAHNKKISKTLKESYENGTRKGKNKEVLQLDINKNFIREWSSATEAASSLGFHQSTIQYAVNRPSPSKSFYWVTKNQFSPR